MRFLAFFVKCTVLIHFFAPEYGSYAYTRRRSSAIPVKLSAVEIVLFRWNPVESYRSSAIAVFCLTWHLPGDTLRYAWMSLAFAIRGHQSGFAAADFLVTGWPSWRSVFRCVSKRLRKMIFRAENTLRNLVEKKCTSSFSFLCTLLFLFSLVHMFA